MWLLRLLRVEMAVLVPSSKGWPLVHFTYRQYPFAIIQGDVLYNLKLRMDRLEKVVQQSTDEDLRSQAAALQQTIRTWVEEYSATCKENRCGGFTEGKSPW
jgi:predicted esterase